MRKIMLKTTCTLALVIAGMVASGMADADRPPWAGGGNGNGKEKREHGNSRERDRDERSSHRGGSDARVSGHFGDRHRVVIRDYYAGQFRSGRCPPGLAKKHNGCMPPGLARKWSMGRPLPRDVVYYDLPPALVVEIGVPPPGYRYVRVASDILMIAVGTGMVVDAIQDLGR